MRFIPNVPPKVFTFSAVIVGYLLIDDTTANEQNALGNWLMLVAQVLCTNAYYNEVQKDRYTNQSNNSQISNAETIDLLMKIVNALNEEINEIKKEL